MGIVTIRNLLDRAKEFEQRLESYYASLRDESTDDGVRLLTYYLSRHRRRLDQALASCEGGVLERINNVQLKHDVVFDPEKGFPLMRAPAPAVKGRELLEAAVGHDTQLVNLYRQMLRQPLGQEASSLVDSLIRLEEKDIVMLKKMIAMNYF